jgi:hypothetical protein
MPTVAQISLDLELRLEASALAMCRKLVELCRGSDPVAVELRNQFHDAIVDIASVRIQSLNGEHGAFLIDDGILRINEEPVAALFNIIVNDLQLCGDRNGRLLLPEEVPVLLERILTQYILHELNHRTQGVGVMSSVKQLTKTFGKEAMVEFDLLADRNAAFAFAALHASDSTREQFLENFRQALFFSGNYFFRVFPAPQARPDKIERAIGVLLMAARLAALDLTRPICEPTDLPYDAALVVKLSTKSSELAIYRGEPMRRLIAFANDESDVKDLISEITEGEYDAALTLAVRIVNKLRLV